MYGHSFCHSAVQSFKVSARIQRGWGQDLPSGRQPSLIFPTASRTAQLVLNNFTYVAVLSGMSFIVTLLGKISVTALCTFVAFLWLEFDKGFQFGGERELNSIWLPLLVRVTRPPSPANTCPVSRYKGAI